MSKASDPTGTRPVGTLRSRQKEETRRRLMDAAMAVFAEKGYSAATVDEIARYAGASTATFYLHFRRKMDVLTSIMEEEAQRVYFASEPYFGRDGRVSQKALRTWTRELLTYWQEFKVPYQVMVQASQLEPELKGIQGKRLTAGVEFWESFFVRLGLQRSPWLRAEAVVLNAQVYGLFEMLIVHGVEVDREDAIEALAASMYSRFRSMRQRPAGAKRGQAKTMDGELPS